MSLTPEETARIIEIAMDLARAGDSAQLREFVSRGFPVNQQDADGNTLLMLAAYNGWPDTVQMLIDQGADVDLRNSRDQSPVAGALFKGERGVVDVLIAAGADLDAGTPTARQAAEMFGQPL